MTEWIEFDLEARVAGIMPAGEKFLGEGNAAYDTMCAEARELSDTGLASAFFVPATRFMIDATLGVLEQPQVIEQLPAEVNARAKIATDVVKDVTRVGVDKHFFLEAYSKRESLAGAEVAPVELVSLDDENYLSSIGMAPFYDVSVVVGGAAQLLKENGVDAANWGAILQRSTDLANVARLRKDETEAAFTWLGKPYVDSRFLQLENASQPDERSVSFRKTTRDFLEQFYGRGCPTGRMQAEGHNNLLHAYWQKFVTYLVTENAAVEAYRPQPADLELPGPIRK